MPRQFNVGLRQLCTTSPSDAILHRAVKMYHSSVTIHQVVVQYEQKLNEFQLGLEQARSNSFLSGVLLTLAVLVFLGMSLFALRQQASLLWPSIPAPFAAIAARRLSRNRQTEARLRRLQKFYDRAIQRISGNWVGKGDRGEEFDQPNHPYAGDLNIFGEGSLFERICTARTAIGRRGIAKYLLEMPEVEETTLRQEAVEELRNHLDLRERLAMLGEFEFLESKWETFSEWLDTPTVRFPKSLRVVAFISSVLIVCGIPFGLTGLVPWPTIAMWISPLIVFHAVVGLLFRARVNRMIEWVRPISFETQVLREGLQVLEQQPFQSVKLRGLRDRTQRSAKAIQTLERMLYALKERNRDWFYLPSLILLVGTQLCMAIEKWRFDHRAELNAWLDAWAEFEALNALANYAYENPENTLPEVLDAGCTFEATALGHPLLGDSCVTNDIRLDQGVRFYIVSGSNMSGKSTLLRAIGLNAVLALAGAPVRAQQVRLSRLSVCASISLTDSLLNGKSKFMAEVDRLRQMIETGRDGTRVLFLIDEIFAGTNSRDRRVATEAVVRTLLSQGAVGALSTHDLALTEIAASDLCGMNVHTGSRDGTDPMDFDFQLKPGITNESSALAIARMAGVPV